MSKKELDEIEAQLDRWIKELWATDPERMKRAVKNAKKYM